MKKKSLLIFACVALSMNAFSQIPTTGLIRHYPFSGDANDSSTNQQNGVVFGATLTEDRFGNLDSAYEFNGTNTNYINIPTTGLNLNQYSYSAWVSLNALPAVNERFWVLSIGNNGGEQFLNYNNLYTAGVPQANNWGGGNYNTSTPHCFLYENLTTSTPLNEWFLLTITRSTTQTKFYVNGDLISTSTVSASNVPNYGTGGLISRLGCRYNATFPLNGKLDEVRIYNRALTQEEINSIYDENLSITSLKNKNLKIYPNPTKDQITIDLGDNSQLVGGNIKIINLLGQTVFTSPINHQQNTINLSNMEETGVYFVHLFDPNNNTAGVEKIILQ